MISHPHPAANQISINTQMFLTDLISFLKWKRWAIKENGECRCFFCLCCSICNCFLRGGCGPNKQKLQLSIQTLDEVFLSSFSPLTDLTRHLKATVPGFLFCFFIARLFYLFCLFFGGGVLFACLFFMFIGTNWNSILCSDNFSTSFGAPV